MFIFNAISNTCQAYYDDLPDDTLSQVGKSAIYTFTVVLIVTNSLYGWQSDVQLNLARPLMAASVAATASLVHALTTPLFNYIFGDNQVMFHRELVKAFINLTCTYALFNYLTPFKTDVFALQIFNFIPINLIKSQIDLLPAFVNWLGTISNDHHLIQLAQIVRYGLAYVGLDVPPDSNSVYFFPAL